jgi:hypothetical protein
MAKRDLEKIIGYIEDAKTDVEEAREEHNDKARDEKLEDAQRYPGHQVPVVTLNISEYL